MEFEDSFADDRPFAPILTKNDVERIYCIPNGEKYYSGYCLPLSLLRSGDAIDIHRKMCVTLEGKINFFNKMLCEDSKNYDDLFKLCQELASNNICEAQFVLAMLYKSGNGTKRDLSKCIFWLRESISLNKSKIALIDILMNGNSEEKNEAYSICEKLSDLGHRGAQYRLALMYLDGIGVIKNRKKAIDLLKQSAPFYKKSEQLLEKMINGLSA